MSVMQEIAIYYKKDYKKYLIAYDVLTYNYIQIKNDIKKGKITKKEVKEVLSYLKANYDDIVKRMIDKTEESIK